MGVGYGVVDRWGCDVRNVRVSRRGVLGASVLTVLAACGNGSAIRGPLRIATGGVGGVYYAYGTGIAAALQARLAVSAELIVTAASIENIRLVIDGDAEVGFTLADSAGTAFSGLAPFTRPTALAALARLYDNYLHLVTRPELPFSTVQQLRGRRVSLGAAGSGTELTARRLLEQGGVRSDELDVHQFGVDESAAALGGGHLDAFFFSGGIPTAAIDALMDVHLVDLGALVAPMRRRYGEVYAERTIPGSTYGIGSPVATIGVPNYLVVSPDMADDVAYAIIETLFRERATLAAAHPEGRRLDRGSAINTFPLPLHPGAVRYYRTSKR